jgi:hypothetical protein
MTCKKNRRGYLQWLLILLVMITAFFTGCVIPTGNLHHPYDKDRKRFSARKESEDGAIIVWSGYTEGYEPGTEAPFDITIKNETEQIWYGRYCLQLMARHSPIVVSTLEQRLFTLEPGVGFSDVITVQLPTGLDGGVYGLSLPVRRANHSMVDLVSIRVGETNEVRQVTTQQDLDAALAACPSVDDISGQAEYIVKLAKTDLAQQLDLSADQIKVQSVTPVTFPDASLGVPEPGRIYAQVITPGYIIELSNRGQIYRYHASNERIVAVPKKESEFPDGNITIEGVEVKHEYITVRGKTTLYDGSCIGTELLADGVQLDWWPIDSCVPVNNDKWEFVVELEEKQGLQSGIQYIVRAYQSGDSNIVTTFPFDLDGPQKPSD